MRALNLFSAILFSILAVSIRAQSPAETLDFARQQSSLGNHAVAVKALNRLVFFDNSVQFPEAFRLLADSYYSLKEYSNAVYYYDLAITQSESDSLKAELTLSKASCRIHEGGFREAQVDLLSFTGTLNKCQQWQFEMLSAIVAFHLGQYEEARNLLLQCSEELNGDALPLIESGFERLSYLEKRYNPRFARVMSMVIPGSGQMVAGDYRNGVNSFLLVVGFIAAGVGISASVTFFDAALIIFPWFQRYYMGGYQKAYIIAMEKQLTEKNKVLAGLVNALQQPNCE